MACSHEHPESIQDGDDLVMICKDCGMEMSRVKDVYKK